MFLRTLLLVIIGFASGLGVASGTFAFLLLIRVVPRMVQKAKLEHKAIYFENKMVQGILFGTVVSLFYWKKRLLFRILGKTLLSIYGLSAGIFTGCIAVALAEILDVFPIFFRRLNIAEAHCESLLFVMAVGKLLGSLFYFFAGYVILSP